MQSEGIRNEGENPSQQEIYWRVPRKENEAIINNNT